MTSRTAARQRGNELKAVAQQRRLQPDAALNLRERRLRVELQHRALDIEKSSVHGADKGRMQEADSFELRHG
jgi:hypothetical protein